MKLIIFSFHILREGCIVTNNPQILGSKVNPVTCGEIKTELLQKQIVQLILVQQYIQNH